MIATLSESEERRLANDPDPDRRDGQEAMAMTAATTCSTLPEGIANVRASSGRKQSDQKRIQIGNVVDGFGSVRRFLARLLLFCRPVTIGRRQLSHMKLGDRIGDDCSSTTSWDQGRALVLSCTHTTKSNCAVHVIITLCTLQYKTQKGKFRTQTQRRDEKGQVGGCSARTKRSNSR